MADAHLTVREAFAAWDADKYTLTTDSSSAIVTTATMLCVRVTLSFEKDDAFEGVPAWLEQTLDCDISQGDLDDVIGPDRHIFGWARFRQETGQAYGPGRLVRPGVLVKNVANGKWPRRSRVHRPGPIRAAIDAPLRVPRAPI